MSTGFRIFLLSLALFGAVWIYRFRSPEIEDWLRQSPLPLPQDTGEPLISQVNRIPELNEPLTRLSLQGQAPASRVDQPPRLSEDRDRSLGLPPWPSSSSSHLSDEETLVSADLPLFQTEDEPEGAVLEDPLEAGPPGRLIGGSPGRSVGGSAGIEKETEPALAPPAQRGPEGTGVVDGGTRAVDRGLAARPDKRKGEAPSGEFDEILYTVQDGDSLWKIAQTLLGQGTRYPEIRELNRSALGEKNLDRLLAGTLLKVRIPASKSPSAEK